MESTNLRLSPGHPGSSARTAVPHGLRMSFARTSKECCGQDAWRPGPHDAVLRRHLVPGMSTSAAPAEAYPADESNWYEPVFGIIKRTTVDGRLEIPAARPRLTWRPSGQCWPQSFNLRTLKAGVANSAPSSRLFNGPTAAVRQASPAPCSDDSSSTHRSETPCQHTPLRPGRLSANPLTSI